MTTIGISFSSLQAAVAPEPPAVEEASATGEKPKKPLSANLIPVTLCVGFLLGVVYVGGRIVSAKTRVDAPQTVMAASLQASEPPAATAAKEPLQTVVVPPPPPPQTASSQPQVQPPINPNLVLLSPEAGDTYIQLAALPPRLAIKYVDELHVLKIDAHIAPGPSPDALRILVGPYRDADTLNQAKAGMEAAGLTPMIRAY